MTRQTKQQFKNKKECNTTMKSRLFILLGVSLLLIPVLTMLASALEDSSADYLIKQYSVFDLKRNCIYNSSSCSYAASCNATIVYLQGNGTILYNNTLMTNRGSYHNLTLTSSDTSLIGWYQAMITCEDRGDSGSESFYYEITPTGAENNTTIFLIIAGVLIAVIVLGFILNDLYIVFIGGACCLVLGIYSMINGFGNVTNDYTRMIAAVITGIGFILTLSSAYSLVNSMGSTGYEEVLDEGDI